MNYILGIDLGGTRIKVQAIDPADGRALESWRCDTRDGEWENDVPAFAVEVGKTVAKACQRFDSSPQAIGISSPGLADETSEAIAFMPGRMKGLEGFRWPEFLGMPGRVRVLNDGHAALIGEVWQGAAKGMQNVFLLTLGTGVGGAIICNGRLLRGHIGRAGHLGHVTVDFRGQPDICGIPGSLEDAVGNWTVGARSAGAYPDTRTLTDAMRTGDRRAEEIWRTSVQALAAGTASLINVLDPEAVIIGGGIANVGNHLFLPLKREMEKMEWRPRGHGVTILPARLGDRAGGFGAAWYAMDPSQF